jgi:hypothetical protein
MSLQDDSLGIRCLGIMYAKFGRNSDAGQINFIQPEHACWRLSERGSSRKGIRSEIRGPCKASRLVGAVPRRNGATLHR